MSSKYYAKPTIAPNATRPGESTEYVGTRNTVGFLPALFQTPVNKKFLDSTLEQLLSSGSLEAVNSYVGSRLKRHGADVYVTDNRPADNYQFVPGSVVRDENKNIANVMSYDDLLDILKFNEVDTTNVNRLFNEAGYTRDLPVNYDMFVNFHKYFWLVDFMPVCDIEPTGADPIVIDAITQQVYYTTPTLSNGKTLEFQNGMRVRFTGTHASGAQYNANDIYIVDGVGSSTGIKFTKQFEYVAPGGTYGKRVWNNTTPYSTQEPSQWDSNDLNYTYNITSLENYDVLTRDFVVEERFATDQSAWSRRNLWMHEETVLAICNYNDLDIKDYALDKFRAVRPVIEFKANIEKYNYGTQHIGNVTYSIDSAIDPTSILGTANWNIASQLITTDWDTTGYVLGTQVRVTQGSTTTYWNCIKTHTDAKNPTYAENSLFWSKVPVDDIADGDTILFLNSSVSTYNNNIYTVGGVGSSITLTETFGPASTTLNAGDKVLVLGGYDTKNINDLLSDSGTELYWNGSSWVYGQQKSNRSDSPLYKLYDVNGVALDNSATYPESSFVGDFIFRYATSESSTVDAALGIKPRYVDYGNTPGLSFDFGLGSVRYTYNKTNTNTIENTSGSQFETIDGYYYYKDTSTNMLHNGWVELRGQQPVKKYVQRIATSGTSDIVINLGTADVSSPVHYKFTKRDNKLEVYEDTARINGVNPSLFLSKERAYTFETLFDSTDLELVNADGTPLSNVTISTPTNNTFTVTVASAFADNVIRYRLASDSSVTGIIYVNTNTDHTNVTVTKNGAELSTYTINNNLLTIGSAVIEEGDIFNVTWFSNSKLVDSDGADLPADTHLLNPLNESLSDASFGDILDHFKQQMTGIPGFTGDFFGVNNYRHMPRVHEFGGTIRQQPFSTELLAQLLMYKDTNLYSSLKFAALQYARFKKQLIQKTKQLHNTTDTSVSVADLVDKALTSINLGKNKNTVFANSQMLKYNNYEEANYGWKATDSTVFALPRTINNYDDANNHIQVWVKDANAWRALVKDVDYTLTDNKITITASMTFDSNGNAYAHVRWYPLDSVSFVPPSAVKLGLLGSSVPSISNSYLEGHDGSITERKGTELYDRAAAGFNIEDAVIWEFETRIYNNLEDSSTVDYKQIMPRAHHAPAYSWSDLTATLRTEFNKWKSRNGVTAIHDATLYDPLNKFTWNYSDVGVGIGGWRGLYTYYFNTYRPDTHPWEMFGYTSKPTWWDANYSWTDAAKRTALITALKTGHYNNPANANKFNPVYAYTTYDWDNDTLVTTAGVLNDPVIANVSLAPADPAAEFVFGDWGEIEHQWRTSSEYKISLMLALAKLRPLWVTNTYFDSNNRTEYNHSTVQVAFANTKQLGNNKTKSLSNQAYNDNIVEYATVKTGGSGYTSAPVLEVYSNFGTGAVLNAIVENGAITAVKVTDPGKDYQSKPTVLPVTGTATFDVYLLSGAKKYIAGLSNAIVNFAEYNDTSVTDVVSRLENYSINPIVKASGFVNSAQEFILESSQGKGRVNIPEENVTPVLYTSQPKEELFFGAVKVTKVAEGYTVSGYDNTTQYFTYVKPKQGTGKVVVEVSDTRVYKYKTYETETSVLDYNTVLRTVQDVYDFVLGYGEYLNNKGWTQKWATAANNFVVWSETAATSDVTYVIPSTKLVTVKEGDRGYFDNIINKFDGEYNVVGVNGQQITADKLIVGREVIKTDDSLTTIDVKENSTSIYGVRLYRVELEHAMVFDNATNFNDIVFDPVLGLRHTRLSWRGTRTKEWNGKLYAPGYVVTVDSIVPNYDTTAREMDLYYGPGNTLSNQQRVDVARFNVGYNKPTWNEMVGLDDDTLFNFMKGTQKYKGTRHALNAFMRNTALFGTLANAKVHEEWAIRTADYGDTRIRDTIEFEITTDLLTTNPQPVRFSSTELNDVLSDIVIDVDYNSNLLVAGTPGNNFTTRWAKTFNYTTISEESVYENDFVSAGLPLATEADYRVLNKEDFELFPEEVKDAYSFDGAWKNIEQWDNKTAYKFKDRVIYAGKVWEMLDPDGTSGLTKPNDIIETTGTTTLPVIPSAGQTLVIDGNTINLVRSAESSTFGLISVNGTNDIGSTASVLPNSTIVLGSTSTDATTITFTNTVTTTFFNDIVLQADRINPQIQGSATKELIIDSTSIMFDDQISIPEDITAQQAFEDAFTSAFLINNTSSNRSSRAIAKINAHENFRSAYIVATDQATYDQFITDYFANSTGGLEINSVLIPLLAGSPSFQTELEALITADVNIVNDALNRTYDAAAVIAGTETVSSADVSSARNKIAQGSYISALATWLKTNTSTTFATTTIIDSTTVNEYKIYNLTDIVNKITSAGIANLTVSTNNNRLLLTKTTNDPSQAFVLVISAASANADVGLSQDIYNSTSSTVTTTPNLTLAQVVNQINNASLTGITATTGGANSNLLQINSNNDSLYIGNGTANSVIGLSIGIVPAPVTTTTVSSSVDLSGIIDIINLSGISGVSASNSNNRLKLTSTNSTLVIGAGTANATVGLTAQTLSATQSDISNVFNAIVGSDGNQVFQEMSHDPNEFSIWVADSRASASGDITSTGYAVYQSMDFDMYITRACAGINDADDAQITVTLAEGSTIAHNLVEGDYVLIRGSNTVPSIDGIHKVTSGAANSTVTFYIDAYIQEEGDRGNVYPLRNVRFANLSSLVTAQSTQVNGLFKHNFAGLRQNNQQKPKYVFVDDNGSGVPAVYKFSGTYTNDTGNIGSWIEVRTSQQQARNDLIDNVKIYDARTRTTIKTLEVFDPAKGIIPGFISDEIDFTLTSDIASYNYNTLDGYAENTKSWTSDKVGVRWWDLKTAVYLDYEQGSIDYKQANWGRLFDGSTIDVYEWTRSSVLPEEWVSLVERKGVVDGIEASGEPFSTEIDGETVYYWVEEQYFNNKNKRTETSYYFWVKNKINHYGKRNYNTYQLSRFLTNPTAFDISWAAAMGNEELILSNIQNYVTDHSVVQVNQRFDSDALPLSEWTLLAEGDETSAIPEYLHIKMRDSLAGYNRHHDRYVYTTYNASTVYNEDQVVQEGSNFYISLANNNQGNTPSADTTMSNWHRIYDYVLPDNTPVTDIDVLRPHHLPDMNLHEYNRYGHLIRPRQSLFRNIVEARQNFVEAANTLLADINIVEEVKGWDKFLSGSFDKGTVTYNTNTYWTFADYYRRTYDVNDAITYEYKKDIPVKYIVDSKDALIDELGVPYPYSDGDTVMIKNVIHSDGVNRPEILTMINNEWVLEWKAKAAIQLSEELWNHEKYGLGFDVSGFDVGGFDNSNGGIISVIFDELRNRVFVGRHRVKYNKLWFKCLYHAVTDNTTDDFAFKTTYVKLNVNHPLMTDKETFGRYNVSVVEDFFNSIKPFHTKLHSVVDANTVNEAFNTTVTEQDRDAAITLKYEDHSERTWAGDTVLEGGTFATQPDNVDAITFTTADNAIEYVYDGNAFVQPVEEGWGKELYPIDVLENIRFRVQTNTSGSTVDADTRTFQMNIFEQYNIEESIAIVDTAKGELANNITATDTDIELVDASMMQVPENGNSEVVWIGTERIVYRAIDGNTLRYCTRGTYATSEQSHTTGTDVVSGKYRVPALTEFGHYGDNLKLAYNDSGVSLATNGTSPEHAFIRNAGFGTS